MILEQFVTFQLEAELYRTALCKTVHNNTANMKHVCEICFKAVCCQSSLPGTARCPSAVTLR